MIQRQHMQVARVIVRAYTHTYINRRRIDPLAKDWLDICKKHGISVESIEHNKKLTITIQLDGTTTKTIR
jgi:hypothetical protein